MYLAELAHGVKLVVGADELEVLHRRHSHAPVEIEPVISLRVSRLPRLKKEHVSVSTLLNARQLQGMKEDRGEVEKDSRGKDERGARERLRGAGEGVHEVSWSGGATKPIV